MKRMGLRQLFLRYNPSVFHLSSFPLHLLRASRHVCPSPCPVSFLSLNAVSDSSNHLYLSLTLMLLHQSMLSYLNFAKNTLFYKYLFFFKIRSWRKRSCIMKHNKVNISGVIVIERLNNIPVLFVHKQWKGFARTGLVWNISHRRSHWTWSHAVSCERGVQEHFLSFLSICLLVSSSGREQKCCSRAFSPRRHPSGNTSNNETLHF